MPSGQHGRLGLGGNGQWDCSAGPGNTKAVQRYISGGGTISTGSFQWKEIPQRLKIPVEIGVLTLSLDGKPVEAPVWDAQGLLWLKREGGRRGEKNFLSVKPLAPWTGSRCGGTRRSNPHCLAKSREEELANPARGFGGFPPVASPIPMLVDEADG